MEAVKGKLAALQRLNWRLISRIALAAVLVILVAWVCISTANTSDMQQKYAAARNTVGEDLFGYASNMALEYDGAELAGADLEGDILPKMRTYYAQVVALNNALASAFGDDYIVFEQSDLDAVSAAFAEYDAAFATGQSTDDAHIRMQEAMAGIRKAIDNHYTKDAILK